MRKSCRRPLGSTDNQPTEIVHDQLPFQRVAVLLPAVVGTLFFWGRSIGLSVTSIRRMLDCELGDFSSFLPGNRNSPD